ASASALTAVVVASCLDRDQARRSVEEPAYVETTSAVMTPASPAAQAVAPEAPISPATRDSTGGVAGVAGTDEIAGAPAAPAAPAAAAPAPTEPTGTTTVTSAPPATQVQTRQPNYTPVPVPFESANGDTSTSGTGPYGVSDANTGVAGPNSGVNSEAFAGPNTGPGGSNLNPREIPPDAANAAVDAGPYSDDEPSNRGSNPQSPSFSAGAGRFVTEAPFWAASAWVSDPNAGAGPFTTERNTPGY
ncbi:MAG: hypothetical protein JWO86_3146, partial [Myxococcaceae bacterium]|nr:hypothetical protein [Myxococcaceae bacterium]